MAKFYPSIALERRSEDFALPEKADLDVLAATSADSATASTQLQILLVKGPVSAGPGAPWN